MILLLGSSGYVGRAFATELRRRGHSFIPLTHQAINYADFTFLFDYVRKVKPEFIVQQENPGASSPTCPSRPQPDPSRTRHRSVSQL